MIPAVVHLLLEGEIIYAGCCCQKTSVWKRYGNRKSTVRAVILAREGCHKQLLVQKGFGVYKNNKRLYNYDIVNVSSCH